MDGENVQVQAHAPVEPQAEVQPQAQEQVPAPQASSQKDPAVEKVLNGSCARFLVLNYTALMYAHDSGEIGLPSLRLGFAQSGDWIETDVCGECVRRLAKARQILTGQWVS